MTDDDLDRDLIRLGLWALFAAARSAAANAGGVASPHDCAQHADVLLAELEQRWPDVAQPVDPTGGLLD